MEKDEIRAILTALREGDLDEDGALGRLAALSVETLPGARVDHHRALRTGFPEVIYCAGKQPGEVAAIAASLDGRGSRILATRCSEEAFAAADAKVSGLHWEARSRLFFKRLPDPEDCRGRVLILSAGTSDIPVADEAAWTARMVGVQVETLYDAGVAGIHRLATRAELLSWADAIVVAAGMEGALASVVGGLVSCPVIAVPTSVGYGSAFGGIAALLGMLNSCAPGVSVVNIDNGFGAGMSAARFARSLGEAQESGEET